ncbi:hypothetical protein Golob_026037 [Gossypium lobatum]|uniref:PHD-type domain-containing protein n=1 Tax=Gossypium lobatum TaxID=34289 RepID=A0A7J8LTU2_9ROSI|nr:hypothetical protein [Gossypium lobatum]
MADAVFNWYNNGGTAEPGTKRSETTLQAKKHLSSMGWVFWYAQKNGRQELRYQSPQGKVYYTLKAACKGYIDETSGAEGGGGMAVAVAADLEPKKPLKRKSLTQENPAFPKSLPFKSLQPPKRGKKVRKQENQAKPRVIKRASIRIREDPVPNSSHRNPRTVLSWLIDNNAVSILAKVYYRNRTGNPLMRGRITRTGIQCDCCFRVFALTAFEAHAGSTNHRPAANIILDDGSGRSLSDCQRQVHDSMMTIPTSAKKDDLNPHGSDDVCSACCDGGELICCDRCPSAFHVNCVGLKEVPDGDWFCPSCCCGICCIGTVSDDDNFLACQQCECKFHIGCLKLKESNELAGKNNWFCSHSCENIFSGLRNLTGKPILVGNNLTWTLLKSKASSNGDGYTDCPDGLDSCAENHSKLNIALDVMHECFEPSKDSYTGRDLVEAVIFSQGSKLKRLNFKGFYIAVLEENDDLVSVATVRVHGDIVAEMSFVATRFSHRRRGMCRALVDELEKNLAKLGVQKLILPAVPAAVDTWVNGFGFSHMTGDERSKLLQYTLVDFQGSIMCQKPLKTEL